jgi:hypothetical protein
MPLLSGLSIGVKQGARLSATAISIVRAAKIEPLSDNHCTGCGVLSEVYPEGFVYAGDSYPNIEVWRRSSGAVFAGDSSRLFNRVKKATQLFAVFPPPSLGLNGLRRALRLHQWVKNALIFGLGSNVGSFGGVDEKTHTCRYMAQHSLGEI